METSKENKSDSGKQKALETTLANLNKKYGDGSVMKLGEATKMQVESIPTGSLSLDIALGVGGIPRGRVIEIYGPESSGKTTLCLHAIAESQRRGGLCSFIDVEHALDPVYAAKIGVDVNSLYVSQPDTGEQALEITEALVRSGAMDVVVVDSVAALVPRAEIEGEMGDSHVGLQARLMSQALRKLTGVVKSSNTCLVFTNQLRQKIGVMFGNPETTSGGMALKFYASVRLDVRRIESIKQGNDVIGNRTRVTVKKNKVAPPFKVAEFDIMYNEGISTSGDLVDLGVEHDIISKRGSFYSYGDIRLGQGRENAKTFLMENPDIAGEIDRKIRDNFGLPVNFEPAPTLLKVPETSSETPATERASAPTGKAARGGMRPAVDDSTIQYGSENDAPSLFSDAA
jgi:recombination protein RecA